MMEKSEVKPSMCTTRYIVVVVGIPAIAICLVVGCAAMRPDASMPWQPGVTESNVARIHPGMTKIEVEGILGRGWDAECIIGLNNQNGNQFCWLAGNHGSVTVQYDGDHRVQWANWQWVGTPPTDKPAPASQSELCFRELKRGMGTGEAVSILQKNGFEMRCMTGNVFGKESTYVHVGENRQIIIWTDPKSVVTGKELK